MILIFNNYKKYIQIKPWGAEKMCAKGEGIVQNWKNKNKRAVE